VNTFQQTAITFTTSLRVTKHARDGAIFLGYMISFMILNREEFIFIYLNGHKRIYYDLIIHLLV